MTTEEKINFYLSKIKNPPGKLNQEEQAILLAFKTWIGQGGPFSDEIRKSGILKKYEEDLKKAEERTKVFILTQYLLYFDPEGNLKESDVPFILEVFKNQESLLTEFQKIQQETLSQIPEPIKKKLSAFFSRPKKMGFSFREWEKISKNLTKEVDQRIINRAALLCIPLFYLNMMATNLIALWARFNQIDEIQKKVEDGSKDPVRFKKEFSEIKNLLPLFEKYKYGRLRDLSPEIQSRIREIRLLPPLTTSGMESIQYLLDIFILISYFIKNV